MADSAEPKKETVRIMVPNQAAEPVQTGAPKRETVRIQLPSRPPQNVPTEPGTFPTISPATAAPKKETARITVLPDPPAKPAVQMKKTQPLIDMPATEGPSVSVTVAPETRPIEHEDEIEPGFIQRIDAIPMALCWSVLGVSAAILLIEIWSYFS